MNRSTADIYDELLALRCQRCDVEAWSTLVERYNDRLFYYVRRLVDDEQQAAHLMQDVWLNALRSIASLRRASRFAPWIYTIARRVVMNDLRQQYANREQTGEEIVEATSDEGLSDDTQLFDNAELVHFGLTRIGRVEREVLTLFFLEDLSIAEIGLVLAVPEGTVKSRLARARRELRQVLERQTDAPIAEECTHDN